MSSAISLFVRALLALILTIGFYVFALVLSGVLLYLPYAEVKYGNRLDLRLAIFSIVGAVIILWSIIPRRDRFVPPGPRLGAAEYPRLFRELNGIAGAVGQPMPREVYLIPQVNAWVMERGGAMGLGSRRVMGLGLPLLQVLTVSELRAVLAHEFGHFYGGDTRLGPLVYKTRMAIGRTLQGLAGYRSILVYPFLWYGKLFMRITQAISRRQELSADELASRIVGSRPLIGGLRAIHGAAYAYDSYWNTEASPALGAGFHPPLAEGFARFVQAPPIKEAIAQGIERELKEAKTDPYESHPSLRDRVVAAENFPRGEAPAADPPAISLFEDVQQLERRMLVSFAGEEKVRGLKPVRWENIGREYLVPTWENFVRTNAAAIAGITPAALPEHAKTLLDLGQKLAYPKGLLPNPDQRVQQATAVLGAALALALNQQGWELHAMPGELYFQRGETKVEPFNVIPRLASGELKADDWRAQCNAAGIADVDLGSVVSPESAA